MTPPQRRPFSKVLNFEGHSVQLIAAWTLAIAGYALTVIAVPQFLFTGVSYQGDLTYNTDVVIPNQLAYIDAGDNVEVLDFDSFRTKAAQDARDEATAAGRVPLLVKDWLVVEQMAAALQAAELAPIDGERFSVGDLFSDGAPEQSLFWRDLETGVDCRARLDWLPAPAEGRRMVIVDYKTATSADPREFGRAVDSYGYHVQQAFYLDAVRACGVHPDPAFVFVVQEKKNEPSSRRMRVKKARIRIPPPDRPGSPGRRYLPGNGGCG